MNDHVPRAVLSALADGECGPAERRWVHAHLAECRMCSDAAAGFAKLAGLVSELPRLVAPLEVVSEALERPGRRGRVVRVAFSGRRGWAAAAAAAAAVVISAAGLVAPPEREEPAVDVFLTRHVGVNDGAASGGQVIFAVQRR